MRDDDTPVVGRTERERKHVVMADRGLQSLHSGICIGSVVQFVFYCTYEVVVGWLHRFPGGNLQVRTRYRIYGYVLYHEQRITAGLDP